MKSIDELLLDLTLEEKAALVAGYKFMRTNPVPRLDIPSIKMSDGPHGLRAQPDGGDNGITNSLPATCFPTGSCSANSFRPELLKEMGEAMAEEAKHYDISVILGPGVNIKRNPRCGRNFEYFSEDPFLSARMGAEEVKGIQSQGIGVSLKHFAGNNSENFRFMGDSVIDERTLREIYLKQFEYIVKEAQPETLMAAYSKINGVHCSENEWLTNQVLRKEWGFKGLVMSDWGTTHDRIRGIKAGMDLEMPGDNDICRKWIVDSIKDGTLSQEELDEAVKNVLNLVYKHKDDVHVEDVDWEGHHLLAKKIALEGATLLKNDGCLPLKENEELLIVGDLFQITRYQGAGSSMINPYHQVSPKESFDRNNVSYKFLRGYEENESEPNKQLIDEVVLASKDYDKVVLFIGLTDKFECEGMDRDNISLPQNQLALVEALVKENKKLVVVLFGGSVVELPFYGNVNAILDMFLSGQDCGDATYDLLFGKANPSGRLTETWPMTYEDVPFGNEYAIKAQDVYKESIYVGYRYYLTANKEVRFPFGYGLSYTSFEYSNLRVEQKKDNLIVKVDVKNAGNHDGAEAVQVYISSPRDNTHKPLRELRGFNKVDLKVKEKKTVTIEIDKEDLRYWDIGECTFVLEDGDYEVQVGLNSRDIVLSQKVRINGRKCEKTVQKAYETLDFEGMTDEEFSQCWNLKIIPLAKKKPFTLESRLSDLKSSFMGKILYNSMQSVAKKEAKKAKKMPDGAEKVNKLKGAYFLSIILDTNSIISLSMSSSGAFPYNFACGFRDLANGHLIRGINHFTKKIKAPALPINSQEEK